MMDAFCTITAGILFQLTVFLPQYLLCIHNKSTSQSSIASCSLFLSRGKVLVFEMLLKCFFKQKATTCPSCSSPSVWSEGIWDQFASVSSASPFRVHPQSPPKVSGCTDPIERTNPPSGGGLFAYVQIRKPCLVSCFINIFADFFRL